MSPPPLTRIVYGLPGRNEEPYPGAVSDRNETTARVEGHPAWRLVVLAGFVVVYSVFGRTAALILVGAVVVLYAGWVLGRWLAKRRRAERTNSHS